MKSLPKVVCACQKFVGLLHPEGMFILTDSRVLMQSFQESTLIEFDCLFVAPPNQQVRSVRLVNEDGIIRPETFYKYLLVWYNMDPIGYTDSQVS